MNWVQLQEASESIKLQLLTIEKLKKQQETIERQVRHTDHEIEDFNVQLSEARKQLHKLEKFSFINLFRTWSGKHDELLEERLDLIAIKELKLIEAQLTKEDLQDDLVDTIQKINAINEGHAKQQLATLENKKQFWLMANAPNVANQLTNIIEQELLVKQLIIEINEAIEAGKTAVNALTTAARSLNSASSYSTWDTFFGGGFIVTALKHDKLDQSNAYIHKAQIALQRFQNELLDIQEMKQNAVEVEVDGFVKFADYFFDDIFSAWSVHSKIATSNNQISRVIDDVSNTLFDLNSKLALAIEQQAKILNDKQGILAIEDESLFFQL
ncbi:hypothetical protein [Solibacillus sp. FSL H8-0538]|uniref:hypothetical protein n=1 Tax=Solibacillus sp. FSL H8-0538 TaxID=2921400 RepID=UPI0030F79FCD